MKYVTARGTFEVKIGPLATDEQAGLTTLGRLSIDKQFHGDLEARSLSEMLTAMTPVKGSAGYVAIERVTGTLAGKQGSFALQHTGTMDRGAQQLRIAVVPDSGTGDLTGLTGELTIQIDGGQHSYELQYSLTTP